MPDQNTMWTRCLGGFSVMWVTKLLISPAKIRIFTTKFGPKLAFLFILRQALPAHLVLCWWVGCGARAVYRKTPIYFIWYYWSPTQPKHLRIVRRQCYISLKPDGSNDPASAEPNKVGPSSTPRLVVVDVKRSRPENPTRVISHIHLGMRLFKRFVNISHSPVCTMSTPPPQCMYLYSNFTQTVAIQEAEMVAQRRATASGFSLVASTRNTWAIESDFNEE